jgi:hypothetical protein
MFDNRSFESGEQLATKYYISIDKCHHSDVEYFLNSSLNESRQKYRTIFKFRKNSKGSTNKIRFNEKIIKV